MLYEVCNSASLLNKPDKLGSQGLVLILAIRAMRQVVYRADADKRPFITANVAFCHTVKQFVRYLFSQVMTAKNKAIETSYMDKCGYNFHIPQKKVS
jgi:hypothetical protein